MKKSTFFLPFFILLFSFTLAQESTLYQLKSGNAIKGTLVSETDSTITIDTALGVLTLDKNEIVPQAVVVVLKSGDVITGSILKETDAAISLKTALGILEISTENIENIEFQTGLEGVGRSALAAKAVSNKWYFSEERLMDIWFDPTGFGLKNGDFYFSALSWAYGITDRVQFSTRWFSYFEGDFNLRPKILLFHKGNIKRQVSASIGGHFHTAGLPRKWEKQYRTRRDWVYDPDLDRDKDTTVTQQEWVRVGSFEKEDTQYDEWNEDSKDQIWGEVFGAFSVSKKRQNSQGRVNYTLGASLTYYPDAELMPRIYAGVDLDANKNMKILAEVFYDPYYIPLRHRFEFGDQEASDAPAPIHFDVGFMTNMLALPFLGKSENLWFGIHFLDPYISIYYKF